MNSTATASSTTQPHDASRARPGSTGHLARDDRWPDWMAAGTAALAALVLITSLVPPWRSFFDRADDPVSLLVVPVVPNLVYAAALAVLAVSLRRRLRAAWWVFVVWLIVLPSIDRITSLVDGQSRTLNAIGLVVAMALLGTAVRSRPQFSARTARRAGWSALLLFAVGTVVVALLGSWLLMTFAEADSEQAGTAVADVLLGDLGLLADPGVDAPFWVRVTLTLLGAAVVLGSAALLFRPPAGARELGAPDEALVRAMLRDHGDLDSLGYFASRRDKAVVWDHVDPAQARAGVSYRVVRGVSLASGNPIGEREYWPAAIEAWKNAARANGWSLAVMAAGAEGAQAFEAAGLTVFEIGDEAILDLGSFSLNAPGLKPVRQAVSRLRRRGYDVVVRRHGLLTDADFARLADSASSWRGDGGDERGFSMALGRLGDPLDDDCVLVEAHDGDGRLRGFISLVPWGRTGLSLDLMRRDPTADNGLVELLVSALAEQAPRFGVRRVSLNFAMFREAFTRGEELGAGPLARLGRQALLLASRNWQLESLYRSNAKYLPAWEPRFICFEYSSDLPRVGAAAGSAEGFLTAPSLTSILRRRGTGGGDLDRADEAYAAQVRSLIPAAPDRLQEALTSRRLPDQEKVRRAKLARLREQGIDPYPVGFPRTHTLAEVRRQAEGAASEPATPQVVGVVGRVLRKRDHGGLCFLTIRDGSGDLQVMASRSVLGDAQHRLFRSLDLGDHVGATGTVVTSTSGELTVDATSFALTSKSLRPLPDKRLGLTDPEARVRMRHVDLIVRPAARDIAYLRSTVVRSIRESLQNRGYVEVETPILQLVHGGANARPFQTHINAYDLELSLRIATELHLKRLVVGGMEQVFELGRQFRNEGADSSHNPEFTSLEVYGTYQDYVSMRLLTQDLIKEAAVAVFGEPVARRRQADGRIEEFDLSGDWPAIPISTAVSTALGEDVTTATPVAELHRHARAIGLELDQGLGWGAVLEEIYGELCEGQTTTPVFYTDFPRDTSPLTRVHREDPKLVEKWDLVIWGSEQGTAYSELIDPVDQRERLVEQSLLAAAGDPEAMEVDEDFLAALEYGMPPTGGMGLGVDRLVMNLTGLGIRDTILFPITKPT